MAGKRSLAVIISQNGGEAQLEGLEKMAVTERELTQEQVMAKLSALQPISHDQQCQIVCSLVGHSRIQTYCFGYYNCARCGAQMGDGLASVYPDADKVVIVGHDCEICRSNYEQCDWADRLLTPDPFLDPREG